MSEEFHLLVVVATESTDECLLQQAVVAVGAVCFERLLIGLISGIVVALRELAVAEAVVGISAKRFLVAETCQSRWTATDELLEVRLCLGVFLLLKLRVSQCVFGKCLVLGVARRHGEVVLQVGVCQRIVCQSVFRFAFPVVSLCIVLRADALLHEVLCTLEIAVGESHHAQVVEHFLLCLNDFSAWILDFVDGGKGGRVVLRGEIHFREVLAHLVLVLRVREFVEEILEGRYRLPKSHRATLVQQESVVVECLFLYPRVEIHLRCLLESHACLVLVLQVDIRDTCMKPCILTHRIALATRTGTQCWCRTAVCLRMEIAHAEFVEGSALRRRLFVGVFLQFDDGVVVVLHVVECLAFDA